jgi:putative ABC transport system permease protein
MVGVIATNLRRRSARTLLTAMGIAVGVATIVALLALSSGLERKAGELVRLGQADLGVFQKDAADPTASVLPLSLVKRLEARPEVESATPLLLVIDALPKAPASVVFGADPNGFVMGRLVLLSGRAPGAGQVVVGDQLARDEHLSVGDVLAVKKHPLTVSGIYHSGILFEDTGAIMPLAAAQRLEDRGFDEATTIAVQLTKTVSHSTAEQRLKAAFSSIQIIGDPADAARAGANGVLISKAVLLIVALALIIGGLSVANTMVMAVLERQQEIALLATIGWSPARLSGLILGEAVGVSLLGAGIGLLLGVVGSNALAHALGLSAFVTPHVTAWGLGRGLLIGIGIGVLGGLYPTWRVSRLAPVQVLGRA